MTLVELIVAMVILAAMMAMALPSMAEYIARKRVDGAANELMTMVRMARSLPLSYGKAIQLSFNSSGDSLTCYSVDDNVPVPNVARVCDCTRTPNATCPTTVNGRAVAWTAYATVVLPSSNGVVLKWQDTTPPSLTFDINGLPPSGSSLSINIESPHGGALQLNMNSAGVPTLCSVSGHSAYPACPSLSP